MFLFVFSGADPLANMETVTIVDKLVNEIFFISLPQNYYTLIKVSIWWMSTERDMQNTSDQKDAYVIVPSTVSRVVDGLVEWYNRNLLTMLATSAK